MKNRFFAVNKHQLTFEWNAASKTDWLKIKKLFVSAYQGAYKDCDISLLALDEHILQLAKKKNKEPLQLYFEGEFKKEFSRISKQPWEDKFKINYLTVKFHDQPIAFIASQFNYKTGRIYIRWNTVSPNFQHLGLGQLMLNEVKNYYQCDKIELYTRILNKGSRSFYKKYGMVEINKFNFDEPRPSTKKSDDKNIAKHVYRWLSDNEFEQKIYPPIDEKIEDLSAFIGYCKL